MKTIKQLTIIVLVAILFSSCAKIFYSPDAYTLAHKQKIIAIIPPTVSIAAKRKFSAQAIKAQRREKYFRTFRILEQQMLNLKKLVTLKIR